MARDFEDQIFFEQSFASYGAEIPAAVAGVESDAELAGFCSELIVFRFHGKR